VKSARAAVFREEIYGIFSSDPGKQYDMREIIARVVDAANSRNIALSTAKTLLCDTAHRRLGSRIVANQKNRADAGARLGPEAYRIWRRDLHRVAEKAARFILDCNQNRIPLVFSSRRKRLMVGKDAEWSGIIRAGAKMVNAVANASLPKITVICGAASARELRHVRQSLRPRFMLAWPTPVSRS